MRFDLLKCTAPFLALALAACGESGGTELDLTQTGDMAIGGSIVEISGDLDGDQRWTADKQYVLKSNVFMKNGTLTIEPGTTILGQTGTSLFITSTAKIDAVGTADKPIVFTSAKPVGQRKPQDWGGLIMLGKAKINVTGGETIFEALSNDERGKYGGQDDTHDCGKIKYARFEFGGFPFQQDKEYNNLTLAACGSQTQIDYVQAHKGADDGVEIFGGTVSLKHIIISQNEDDGLDWDYGWRGSVQFMIIQHTPAAGNHGFEADNNASDNNAEPRSNPTIFNVTYIGSAATTDAPKKDKELIAIFRTGTWATIGNSVFMGARTFPIDVTNPATVSAAKGGKLKLTNSIFYGNTKQDAWDDAGKMCDTLVSAMMRSGDCAERGCVKGDEGAICADTTLDLNEGAWLLDAAMANLASDPKLADPTQLMAPKFAPGMGSPALDATKAMTSPASMEPAPFLGAIGATDWTAGWSAYPQN